MKTPAAGARVGLGLGAVALALGFQGGLLFGGSLHHFDWLIHWHYYDWVRTGFQEYGTLPRFMIDAWHTANFVANAQSPVFGPLVWLLAFLPTELYVKLLIAFYTALGLVGAYTLGRDLGARPSLSACAAVLWCCNGFFAAHVAVGHHWSLGTYWMPWVFLLVRRGRAGSGVAWLGLAGVQALALLEGQHHPFLWQNGLVALWLAIEGVRRREIRTLGCWLGATLFGAALAGARVVPLVLEFAHYLPADRIGGIPPGALLFSLLSRSQGPATSGFGVVFDHGSGWWEYTFYLGVLGVAFVGVGAIAAWRRQGSLLAVGLAAALLSLDTSRMGFDLWELLRHVPVAASQRCPARLLVVTLFAGIFAATVGWERLLAGGLGRRPGSRHTAAVFWALAVVLAIDLTSAARPWQAAAVGPLQQPRPHRIAAPHLVAPAHGRVVELRQTPNRLEYRVASDRPGFLAVEIEWDRYGPDWRADPLATVRAPTGHLAVRIPKGETDVTLRYRTPGLALGLGISTVALLAWLGLLLRSRRRWIRTRVE